MRVINVYTLHTIEKEIYYEKETNSSNSCTSILTNSIPVFATTGEFEYFWLAPGSSQQSYLEIKSDSEQKAYVTITDADFVSSDKVWFRVREQDGDSATETKWFRTITSFTLNYSVRTGVAGGLYYLKGQSDSTALYPVSVEGRWTP